MATLEELRSYVVDVIRDSALGNTEIDKFLNLGVSEIAAGMESSLGSFVTPPLPELFTIATIDTVTTAAYVSMPATFGRALRFCCDSNGVEIDISNSMIEFAEGYPLMDRSGSVVEVIEQGGNLYYQGIPTANEVIGSDTLNYTCILNHTAAAANYPVTGVDYETYWSQTGSSGATWAADTAYEKADPLTIHFFRLPVDMSATTDTPDGIPLSMQVTLLVNYVAYKIYEITEDGVNRKDSKYNKHKTLFREALRTLELSIPYDTRSLNLSD